MSLDSVLRLDVISLTCHAQGLKNYSLLYFYDYVSPQLPSFLTRKLNSQYCSPRPVVSGPPTSNVVAACPTHALVPEALTGLETLVVFAPVAFRTGGFRERLGGGHLLLLLQALCDCHFDRLEARDVDADKRVWSVLGNVGAAGHVLWRGGSVGGHEGGAQMYQACVVYTKGQSAQNTRPWTCSAPCCSSQALLAILESACIVAGRLLHPVITLRDGYVWPSPNKLEVLRVTYRLCEGLFKSCGLWRRAATMVVCAE
jgi:hypothetical protein